MNSIKLAFFSWQIAKEAISKVTVSLTVYANLPDYWMKKCWYLTNKQLTFDITAVKLVIKAENTR